MIETLEISVEEVLQKEIELGVPSRAWDWKRDSIIQPAPSDRMTVTIVAVKGGNKDWSAYSGIPRGTRAYVQYMMVGVDMNDPEKVQSNGDKLNPTLA